MSSLCCCDHFLIGSIQPSIADVFHAKVADVSVDSMILEMTGNHNKLEAFLELMGDYEILELARTGMTGLSRGSQDVTYF